MLQLIKLLAHPIKFPDRMIRRSRTSSLPQLSVKPLRQKIVIVALFFLQHTDFPPRAGECIRKTRFKKSFVTSCDSKSLRYV